MLSSTHSSGVQVSGSALTEAITPNPPVFSPETPLMDVIAHMSQVRFKTCQMPANDQMVQWVATAESCALVMAEGQVIGICTERDLVRLAAQGRSPKGLTVAEVMTHPVITWTENQLTDLFSTLQFMQRRHIRHLPILNQMGDLLGIVTPQSLRQLLKLVDLLRLRQISEVMQTRVVQALPDTSVLTIAHQMAEQRVSCVVIVEPSSDESVNPVGIITERDIVQFQCLELNLEHLSAQTVMSTPLCSLHPHDTLWSAHQIMQEQRIRRLVITNQQGHLQGLITQTSMLHILTSTELHETFEVLQQRIDKLEAEKLELLHNRNQDLEQQVNQRTVEIEERADREEFLAALARQISQTLDLETMLSSAVAEVKRFLGCDRVVVYKFQDQLQGQVIAEAADPEWASTLGHRYEDVCFPKWLEAEYLKGQRRIVDDIYQANLSTCHIEFLEALHIKGYLIVPLIMSGHLWGLLVAHQCAMAQPWLRPNLDLLDRLGTQLAIAIQQSQLYQQAQIEIQERQQAELALHSLVKGTASVTGENFFDALVQHIVQALNVRYAVVTALEGNHGRTLAFCANGQLQDTMSYELEQQPCTVTLQLQVYCCPSELSRYFPEDQLGGIQAESYLGVALLDIHQHPIGTLCIFDSKPLTNASQVESILKIFAARAAAELERQQTIEALHQLNQELEARVATRTKELSNINMALLDSNLALLESQEQLRQSEDLLRLTIDNAPIGIVTSALDGQFRTVNQAFCTMLGYTPEEMLEHTFISLTHPNDQSTSQRTIQQMGAGDMLTVEMEKRYLHKDGSAVDAIVRIATVRDSQGKPLQFVAEIEDIRQRKRSEAERTRLLNILEASLNEIYIFDANTLRFSYVNQGALQNLGYTLEQMKQMGPLDIKPELSPEAFEVIVAPLRHHETDKIHFEALYQRADGSRYPVEIHLQLIERETERIFLAVVLDITERKQAGDQINRQLLAIESVIDGIAILRGGTYQYLNQAHVDLFGYSSVKDLLGQSWERLYSPEEIARFQREIFPVLATHGHWQGEALATRKDGSTFYEEVSLTLSSDGDLICVCRDITERKQAEADIRKALESERELNDLKSRFVSMTSHEFRTPLGVIASSAGIIQDYGDRLDAAKKSKHLKRIQDSVTHMTQLLEDVLMLSRLEANKLRLKLMPTSIYAFCQEIIEELNTSDNSSRIQIQVESTFPDFVMVDQRLLRQILNNLLSNALKYSIPESQVYLRLTGQDACFVLTIQDQGIGIPPEDLKHLFNSFHRAKNVGNIPGTGLGLSIVKKLIELHQGKITCQSQVNIGTTFTVCLPLRLSEYD